MIKKRAVFFLLILLCIVSGVVLAQRHSSDRSPDITTQVSISREKQRLPNQKFINSQEVGGLFHWDIDPEFSNDVFTFVRIDYDYTDHRSMYGQGSGGGTSKIDYPDSDNNFSFRLQQLTSIEVNPEPIYITLEDSTLSNYPFIYLLEPRGLHLGDKDVKTLRQYLLNGGFLMIDDFWGSEWSNVRKEMKKVFPEYEPVLLTLDHPVFHCVFDLKELPQIPAIDFAVTSSGGLSGTTSESNQPARYYAINDDKDRMMVIICRDTDLGDGWEREGENHAFFKEFSEKKAYPLGINIVFYAMTH